MISAAGKNPDADISKGRLLDRRAFMPRVSLKRLTRIWQEEPTSKTKQMFEACRRRKEGRSIQGAAREMGLAYSTVRDWLVRMHAGNSGRRFDCRHTDRMRVLTGAALAYIKRWLNGNPQRYGFGAGSWQVSMVLEIVRKRFGYPAGCARSKGHRGGWAFRTASPGRSPTSLPLKQNGKSSNRRPPGC